MSVRIRLLGLAGPPRATTIDGWYLVSCNVNENKGRGSIIATPDPSEATVFADAAEAMAYWQRQSTTVPLRGDGKPNRPLTMFSIEVEPIKEERTHAQDPSTNTEGHPESGSSPHP